MRDFSGSPNAGDFYAQPNADGCGLSSTGNAALGCHRNAADLLDVASSASVGEPGRTSGAPLPSSLGCSGQLPAQEGSIIGPQRPLDISFHFCQQNSCNSKSLLSHGQRGEQKYSLGNFPSDGEGLYQRDDSFSCVSDSYDYVGKSPELLNPNEIQREGVGLRDFKTPQGSRYEISASGDSPSAQFAATPCGPAPELGEQLSRAPADLSASVNGVFAIPRDISLHGRGNKSGALCFELSYGSGNGISKTRNNELQDVGRGLKRDVFFCSALCRFARI